MSDELKLSVGPVTGYLCISASDAREVVRITHDGHVIVNPEFTVDEAARAFWDAVKRIAAGERP